MTWLVSHMWLRNTGCLRINAWFRTRSFSRDWEAFSYSNFSKPRSAQPDWMSCAITKHGQPWADELRCVQVSMQEYGESTPTFINNPLRLDKHIRRKVARQTSKCFAFVWATRTVKGACKGQLFKTHTNKDTEALLLFGHLFIRFYNYKESRQRINCMLCRHYQKTCTTYNMQSVESWQYPKSEFLLPWTNNETSVLVMNEFFPSVSDKSVEFIKSPKWHTIS